MSEPGKSAVSAPAVPAGVPVVDLNPFSDEVLTNPQDFTQVWLEGGPIFWLSSIGTYCIARHADLVSALKDWEHFGSGGGIGLTNKYVDPGTLPKSLLLEADPPEHSHSRAIMNKIFSASALQPLFERFSSEAEALIETLVARGRFDAMSDLASIYGHRIVPREIGLAEHRPDLLFVFGASLSNGVYPRNQRHYDGQADPLLREAIGWIAESCSPEKLSSDGWGAAVHAAAERGECTPQQALLLTRSLIGAGVENTVIAIGNLINALATHPDQWDLLKADPKLVRNAIEEVMRWDGPSMQFFRTTPKPTTFGGTTIPEGTKVLMQFYAANRDPRRWPNPDQFDITRNTTGHVGFGFGIHHCLGQVVARKQMAAILEALLRRARSIRLAEEPTRRLNNQAHVFAKLPIEVVPC